LENGKRTNFIVRITEGDSLEDRVKVRGKLFRK
jgi:hypothetical protein